MGHHLWIALSFTECGWASGDRPAFENQQGQRQHGNSAVAGDGVNQKKWMPSEKRDFYEAVPNPSEALRNLYQNMLKSRLNNSQEKMKELTCLLEAEKSSLSREDFKHIQSQLKNLDRLREKISRFMPAVDILL